MTNWILSNQGSLAPFLPELVLAFGALFLILMSSFRENPRKFAIGVGVCTLTVFLYTVGHLFLYATGSEPLSKAVLPPTALFSGMIVIDAFALFFKLFFGVTTLIILYFVATSKDLKGDRLAEIVAFLLAITLGMSLMAAAQDLLMVYLGIEMVSILSYVLVGYRQKNRTSSEAGLKYMLYGGFASAVMVFSFSLLYGLVGSTDLPTIATAISGFAPNSSHELLIFMLTVGILAGLGYKIASFPTHMWCPDVYEGAPLPITAYLSVAPKAAGFALLVRFWVTFFDLSNPGANSFFENVEWGLLIAFIACATMTIGNLAALNQRNLKRLLAYSSIAHAGYMLIGFCTFSVTGVQAILFYLITYLLMNLGAFLILHVISNEIGTEELDGYKGLGWRSPFLSWTFTIFLFSLVGLPPFAGFLGKLILFAAVVQEGLYWLATIAVINTVISLFYYMKIVRTMFFDTPVETAPITVPRGAVLLGLALALPTLLLVVYWEPLFKLAEVASSQLF